MILRKDYEKAIESFSAAFDSTESEEDRSYALFRQAFSLVQANRPAEAAEKYEQLLADFPDSQYAASAVLASAQSTYRSGDIDEAAKRFRKVLQQNNLQAATEAAHWLARIEISKGRPAEAASDRETAARSWCRGRVRDGLASRPGRSFVDGSEDRRRVDGLVRESVPRLSG